MELGSWIGLFFWPLVVVSIFLVLISLYKKSVLLMILGAIGFLPMTFYFIGAENWLRGTIIIPVLILIFASAIMRKTKS